MEEIDGACVVCTEESAEVYQDSGNDRYKVICPYCGDYLISDDASRTLASSPITNIRQRTNARSWVRENRGLLIRVEDLGPLRTLRTPSVAERAEKLLIAIDKTYPSIGAELTKRLFTGNPAQWCARSWSANPAELSYLLTVYMTKTKGWLLDSDENFTSTMHIAPNGYDHLEELRLGGADRVSGFCAMWFNEEVAAIWTDAIKPAINAAGYDAVRIDGVEHNNKIDDEILANIRSSRFVVADFTGERGGVYFEAGFAMGLGLPVIWTVREDALTEVHFDNRQYNFIVWKPEDLPELTKRLQLRIEATIGRGPVTPQAN
ncbi:hypothetical protein [Massilia sp. TWR1-2-2]|uniref:hypothetical protein n=1 Tax=Massilia sp. TWR1-2-2 TaxID=2804584 RepID=UPI003CF8C717